MTFDKEVIDYILDDIIFPIPEIGIIEDDDCDSCVNLDIFKDRIRKSGEKITIEYGMSKFVLISPLLTNVVIKIPFNGSYEYDEETGELFYKEFEGASNDDDWSDYCLAEYNKYLNLKHKHLDCFVAKTLYYKTINNTRIFLQEKVIPKFNIINERVPSERSHNQAKAITHHARRFSDNKWVANCIDLYGENKVEQFFDYCTKVDSDILNDCHSGNYGYRLNGTPVIFDYSDFKG